jgi:hypothetical protein
LRVNLGNAQQRRDVAGIVECAGDAAVVPQRSIDESRDVLLDGHVGRLEDRPAAVAHDVGRDALARGRAARRDDDGRALSGNPSCHGRSDARTAAGDDDDLPGEPGS